MEGLLFVKYIDEYEFTMSLANYKELADDNI
ncbi:hypothetical protein BB14905_04488 [Bacillus sp. B14905]|nr:hypothetical protein BB14905_04488 [Bacillus sp. B14905]